MLILNMKSDKWEERLHYRKKKNKNWYLKDGKNEKVMFVNETPNEILKIEQSDRKNMIKVKVVERRGNWRNCWKKKWSVSETKLYGRSLCDMQRGNDVDCRMRGMCMRWCVRKRVIPKNT